ncbi:hypothetical protein [Arthrobacter sp. AL12]|uniref:hypothetical protein n=1 Tax=Arthrobacter sp. AL12 TaxID=3042241 RepID=UPI00249C3BFD|nr:hypothetical protein [Arthrobacter sp. AL12]MDI3211796.1 hypothetical protein [Arthrobacter sp. AL12]
MNKDVFVPYTLQKIGIYPYPEFVKLFTDFFENRATKEQLDEVEKHISATKSRNKVTKAYEAYQSLQERNK